MQPARAHLQGSQSCWSRGLTLLGGWDAPAEALAGYLENNALAFSLDSCLCSLSISLSQDTALSRLGCLGLSLCSKYAERASPLDCAEEANAGVAEAMHSIANAVTQCKFEATDPASDEVVLYKILQVSVCWTLPAAARLSFRHHAFRHAFTPHSKYPFNFSLRDVSQHSAPLNAAGASHEPAGSHAALLCRYSCPA